MGLFSIRKKLSEKKLSQVLVSTLYTDINNDYNKIVSILKELPNTGKLFDSLSVNSKEHLITAIFSMELHSIANLFNEEQANRIMRFGIDELSKKLKVEQSEICSSIDEYTVAFQKGIEFVEHNPSISMNPLEFVAEKLYDKIQIAKIEINNRIIQSPTLLTAISSIITQYGGYIKNIKAQYKIAVD